MRLPFPLWFVVAIFIASCPQAQVRAQSQPEWHDFLQENPNKDTRFGLRRSMLFVDRCKEIFRNENVPESLVWIALIESSFRPFAVSRTGAVGLYQFKRETAVHFGLRVQPGRDERTFPFLSAQACARYLHYLYEKFQDWDLVLAAYNLGEGALRRTMQRTSTRNWIQVKVYIRKETQEFVPKVRAAAEIGEQFLKTGQEMCCKLVKVNSGDTLYRLSKEYDCAVEELMRMNGLEHHGLQVGQSIIVPF